MTFGSYGGLLEIASLDFLTVMDSGMLSKPPYELGWDKKGITVIAAFTEVHVIAGRST